MIYITFYCYRLIFEFISPHLAHINNNTQNTSIFPIRTSHRDSSPTHRIVSSSGTPKSHVLFLRKAGKSTCMALKIQSRSDKTGLQTYSPDLGLVSLGLFCSPNDCYPTLSIHFVDSRQSIGLFDRNLPISFILHRPDHRLI